MSPPAGYAAPPGYALVPIAPNQAPPPAPAAPPPPPMYYQVDAAYAANAAREAKLAEREAVRAQREHDAQEGYALHQTPRLMLAMGAAPIMFTRVGNDDNSVRRVRQRTVALTAGLRKHFTPQLGLHTALSVGVGRTTLGYGDEDGSLDSEGTLVVDPGFSFGAEVAPIFGPFRHFYISPGLTLRTLVNKSTKGVLVGYSNFDGESKARQVSFDSPLTMLGARFAFGVMCGAQQRWDISWGFDAGRAFGSADRALGAFVRVGAYLGS